MYGRFHIPIESFAQHPNFRDAPHSFDNILIHNMPDSYSFAIKLCEIDKREFHTPEFWNGSIWILNKYG